MGGYHNILEIWLVNLCFFISELSSLQHSKQVIKAFPQWNQLLRRRESRELLYQNLRISSAQLQPFSEADRSIDQSLIRPT